MPQHADNSVASRVASSNSKERARVVRKYPGVKKYSEGERPETEDEYDDPVVDPQTFRWHPENLGNTPKMAIQDAIDSIKAKNKKSKK